MAMDESAFQTTADETIEALFEAIEQAVGDRLDVDLEGGILTLTLEDDRQYVINKHAPNRQIWLSSPLSGAAHFNYDAARNQWANTRTEGTLSGTLADELLSLTGTSVSLA